MDTTCPNCSAGLPAGALFCARCGFRSDAAREPEFRRWRATYMRRLRILCAAAIPVGLLFINVNPVSALIVSGLGLLGVIVGSIQISRLPAG